VIMQHIELYALRPVNRTAGLVVSQKSCRQDDQLSKSELVDLKNKLSRKHRFIKSILGIRNATHHKNTIHGIIGGYINTDNYKEPRLLGEYKRVGEAIQLINLELNRVRLIKHEKWMKENLNKTLFIDEDGKEHIFIETLGDYTLYCDDENAGVIPYLMARHNIVKCPICGEIANQLRSEE